MMKKKIISAVLVVVMLICSAPFGGFNDNEMNPFVTKASATTFDDINSSTGHSFTNWRATKAATCTADGTQVRTCSVCGENETKVITKLGHNYSTDWTVDVAAICSAVGSKSHHCTRCNDKTEITEIPILNHKFGEWTIVTAATTESEGEMRRVCSNCSEVETRIIDKLPIEEPSYILGDVNNDGKITAADARLALRISAKLETVRNDGQFLAADTDKNKKITAADARKILRVAAKLEKF